MSRSVLVIGAGVVGLCTALAAARRGLRVTVLDAGPPEGDGCSYGNAGLIVPSHVVPLAAPGAIRLALRFLLDPEGPFALRPRLDPAFLRWAWGFWRASTAAHVERSAPLLRDLHLASRELYVARARTSNDFGFADRGLLVLCRTPHGLEEEAAGAARARSLGLPAETLAAQEIAALEPGLQLDVVGGVRYPLDAHLDPGRLMSALRREAAAEGVDLHWGTPARGWRRTGRRVDALLTGTGEHVADEYVVAAGAWSAALAQPLDLALPLAAGKGISLTLPAPRVQPRHPAILSEARVAVTPLGTALRVGGTMELAGLDRHVDPRRVRGILRSLTQYLPDFDLSAFDGVRPWSGLRPVSPDGLPYVGRTSRAENVVFATGHAMMGVSLGPVTGELVAQVLCGEPPSIDIHLLDPDRFN